MWGENSMTSIVECGTIFEGKKLKDILMNKWKKAPIGGEPWPHFPTKNFTPYSTIPDQVKLVRPAKILASNLTVGDEPGNTTHWSVTEKEL